MSLLHEEVSQLISLTQLHLSQEYERDHWLFTDRETLESYKNFALRNKAKSAPQAAPKSIPTRLPPVTKAPMAPKVAPPVKEEPAPILAKPKVAKETHTAPAIPVENFSDIRKMMAKLFPQQTLLDEPLDAAKLQIQHSIEVLLFIDGVASQHAPFLANLTKAIQLCLCPAMAVSVIDKKCEALLKSGCVKIVIGLENSVKDLASRYPQIKLISLAPIQTFFENPSSKATLWSRIVEVY